LRITALIAAPAPLVDKFAWRHRLVNV